MATDRPDQTECANTVPKGFFQMESGFMVKNDKILAIKTKEIVFLTSLLKYGISDKLELRLIAENSKITSTGEYHFEEIRGINPIQIGFKANFLNANGLLPKTSLIAHAIMPKWASDEKKLMKMGYNFRFTMQHQLSEKASLGYNLGSEWDGDTRQMNFIYTLSTCRSLATKVGVYVEVYGEFSKINPAKLSFDGGFTFPLRDNFMLDISASKGLTASSANNYLSLGLSFRLPK